MTLDQLELTEHRINFRAEEEKTSVPSNSPSPSECPRGHTCPQTWVFLAFRRSFSQLTTPLTWNPHPFLLESTRFSSITWPWENKLVLTWKIFFKFLRSHFHCRKLSIVNKMSLKQLQLKDLEAGSKRGSEMGFLPTLGLQPQLQTSGGLSSWHCWKYLEVRGDCPGTAICNFVNSPCCLQHWAALAQAQPRLLLMPVGKTLPLTINCIMFGGFFAIFIEKNWFIQARFNSFTKYLVNSYYVLSIILNSGGSKVDKTDMIPEPTKLNFLWGDGQVNTRLSLTKSTISGGSWEAPRPEEQCYEKNSAIRRLGGKGWRILETEQFTIWGMIQR